MADNEKNVYESPSVTDFGTIEDLTQGEFKVSLVDFPTGVGSPVATEETGSNGSGAL